MIALLLCVHLGPTQLLIDLLLQRVQRVRERVHRTDPTYFTQESWKYYWFLEHIFSVADPFHFYRDPRIRERRIRIRPTIFYQKYDTPKNNFLLFMRLLLRCAKRKCYLFFLNIIFL